jgi:long-chain acyl-CoA synthetase
VIDSAVVSLVDSRSMVCRGVNIIKGYWRNPEATKSAFLENGFYRTGDGELEDKDTRS